MIDQQPTRPAVPATPSPTRTRHRLGLPLLAIIGLALLAAPRVILHDLDLIHEGTGINALFVFVPPIVWIVVTLMAKVPRPFVTVLAIGVVYGVLLALGHQLLWSVSMADRPGLGGNLADLDPTVQAVVVRAFAAVSSLVTGAMVGAVSGLAAWGLDALLRRPRSAR
jgi:hypothetical protein